MKELKLNRAHKQLILDNMYRIIEYGLDYNTCFSVLHGYDMNRLKDFYIPEVLYTFAISNQMIINANEETYPFIVKTDNWSVYMDYDKLSEELKNKFPDKSIVILIGRCNTPYLAYASNRRTYCIFNNDQRKLITIDETKRIYVAIGKKSFIENAPEDIIKEYKAIKLKEDGKIIFTELFLPALKEKAKIINATIYKDEDYKNIQYKMNIPAGVITKVIKDFIDANLGDCLNHLNIDYSMTYNQFGGAELNFNLDKFTKSITK